MSGFSIKNRPCFSIFTKVKIASKEYGEGLYNDAAYAKQYDH